MLLKKDLNLEWFQNAQTIFIESFLYNDDCLKFIIEHNAKLDKDIIKWSSEINKFIEDNKDKCCVEMLTEYKRHLHTYDNFKIFYNRVVNKDNSLDNLLELIESISTIYKINSLSQLKLFDSTINNTYYDSLHSGYVDPLVTQDEINQYIDSILNEYRKSLSHIHEDVLTDFINNKKIKLTSTLLYFNIIPVDLFTNEQFNNDIDVLRMKILQHKIIEDVFKNFNKSSDYGHITYFSESNFFQTYIDWYNSSYHDTNSIDHDFRLAIKHFNKNIALSHFDSMNELLFDLIRKTLMVRETYYKYKIQLIYFPASNDTEERYDLIHCYYSKINTQLTTEQKIETFTKNNYSFMGNKLFKYEKCIKNYIIDYVTNTPYLLITMDLGDKLIQNNYLTKDQLIQYEVDDYCRQSSLFPPLENWKDIFGNFYTFYFSSNSNNLLLSRLVLKYSTTLELLYTSLSYKTARTNTICMMFDKNNLVCKLMIDQFQTVRDLLLKNDNETDKSFTGQIKKLKPYNLN